MSVKNQNGFTLVEISIVMVIIGLLLGGVLKSQELIKNSKIRSIMNDADGMWAALYTYQDRYRALPGDDALAETHIGLEDTGTGTGNGNGNGNGNGSIDTSAERINVFWHLREAGLIRGTGTTAPKHAFGESIVVDSDKFSFVGTVVCFDGLEKEIAHIIDIKEDDGLPKTGVIRGGVRSTNIEATKYTTPPATYDICMAR